MMRTQQKNKRREDDCPHSMLRLIHQFAQDTKGATAIEYGLIVALIFLATVASIKAFSSSTSEMYGDIANAMN